MAKLSKEEADQLAALRAKEEAPDEPEDDGDGGDDGHVIVLRGSRADAFLNSLLGPSKPPRGNAASGPATAKSKKSAPASAAEQAETDEDDQAEAEDAPPPQRGNRYFR